MAMLISSVIVGIVYYVYILFNYQFTGYREKAKVIDEYLMFQKALQKDIELADAIKNPLENEIVCYRQANENVTNYTFNGKSIIRSLGEVRDTFMISNSGYEAVPVKDMDIIETLVLKITVYDEPLRLTFKKLYSACQIMQQQPAYE